MGRTATNDVNRLIGEFTDLQEIWEKNPAHFDWSKLESLAQDGAQAYNEGAGPSFHALALDGVDHSAFHERFLGFLLKAGFDPFRLARPGSGISPVPVIDHANLCEAAETNPSSARIRAILMEIARKRFAAAAEEATTRGQLAPEALQTVAACAESIPSDLLERISPDLLNSHWSGVRRRMADPVEGYLSPAEIIVENSHAPYG